EREASSDEIIQTLRPKLAGVPGINVYLQTPPSIRIGTISSKSAYQYTLQDADADELYDWAPRIEERLRQLDILQDVTNDLQLSGRQGNVEIDRDRARALGVTVSEIETALANAYASRQVSTIYAPTNQYQVILEVQPEFQQDPEALSRLYVTGTNGAQVPLGV